MRIQDYIVVTHTSAGKTFVIVISGLRQNLKVLCDGYNLVLVFSGF